MSERRRWNCMFLVLVALCHSLRADEVTDALELAGRETKGELCPVTGQGAVGDGRTDDRAPIQAAIDECGQKADGGVVTFEDKSYLTGALRLPSKVTLRLSEGTVLLASTKIEDYPSKAHDWYLILVDQATRVSIEGHGKISGQASQWKETSQEKHGLKKWADESCTETICRPSLIGVRESSQVTIEGVQLLEFVHIGISIRRSEAVAVMGARVVSDLSFLETRGVVVDGSKRVFIGQSSITSRGSSIAAFATTGKSPLESLLVDNVVLRSAATAFQVGPAAKAEVKTIVVQNAQVDASHRGLSVQLQDAANMQDIWFTNVTVATQHMDDRTHGAAEGIHVSVKPGPNGGPLGKLSNVWFGNVSCKSEGGFVFSGDEESTIDGVTVKDTTLEMARVTALDAAFRDYRPSKTGIVNATSVPAVFLEFVNHVSLSGLEVVLGTPPRKEWGGLLEMTPHSVHALQLVDVHMHDEAAHPSAPFVAPMKTLSQLGDFFRHSMRDWTSALSQKGFISLQENAAFGARGRRAASSASPIVMGLLLLVLVAILLRYCCLPALRGRGKRLPA